MEREQFTFYASFAKAARKIKKPAERCAYYDALIDYALSGTEPDEGKLPEIVCMAMELVMPVLASSRRKAENGKRGGSKTEANGSNAEANASKAEANPKQEERKQTEANPKQWESASKKEDKKEGEDKKESKKEKENECYLSPPTPSSPAPAPKTDAANTATEIAKRTFSGDLLASVLDWLSYKRERREPYKETGLRTLFSQLRKAADTHGDAAVCEVIRNSMASGYAGITLDRLTNAPAQKPKIGTSAAQKPMTEEEARYILEHI